MSVKKISSHYQSAANEAASMTLLTTLATEIIPAQALRAIFGVGLLEADSWSLRAAEKRTTLLLVWDKEEQKNGDFMYKKKKGRKRRQKETKPVDAHPTTTCS